jgi:hypothetical protein
MPRTRTTVEAAVSSSLASDSSRPAANSSRPPANSNSMPSAGERLPLRPVAPSSALGSIRHKSKRPFSAPPGFVSPILPRAASSLFGSSAADASERSSAPTVAPPFINRTSFLSPFGPQQPPAFVFPPAPSAGLQGSSFPVTPLSPSASAGESTLPLSAAPVYQDEDGFSFPAFNAAAPWPRFPIASSSGLVPLEEPPASTLPPLPLPDFQQQPQPSSSAVAADASAESDALSASAQHPAQTASAAPLGHSPFSPVAAPFTASLMQQVQGSSDAAVAAPSSELPFVDPFPGWPATADAPSPLDATPSVPAHALAPEAAAEPSGHLSNLQRPPQVPPAPLSPSSAQLSTAPGSRVVLTEAAAQVMLQLHTGEMDILQPLDALEVSDLVSQVQATVLERLGSPLRRSMAMTALEVSRHMPGASGVPQLEEALSCLRTLSRPKPHTPTAPFSAAQPAQPAGVRETPPPVPPPAPLHDGRLLQPRSGVPSLSALMPPPAAPATRQVSLTGAAQRDLFLLQTGQWVPLPPLDDFRIAQLVCSLQSVIPSRFGVSASLEHRTALDAVELSRYLPHASGQPSLAGMLNCIELQPLHHPVAPAAPRPLVQQLFLRRASGNLPPPPSEGLVPRPPPVHPYVNSGLLVNSARLRHFAPPSLFGSTPRTRDSGQHLLCPSCGVAGHDALHCPQGLDVSAVVTAAQELGLASQQRILELSGQFQPGTLDASRVVRDEVVDSIAEISGINSLDISSHLDGGSGDAEATFVSAVCHSRGGPDSQFFHDACTRELHRRRHHVRVAEASRLASSEPNNDAAYRSLASRTIDRAVNVYT